MVITTNYHDNKMIFYIYIYLILNHFLLIFKCINRYFKTCFITIFCSKLYNQHSPFDVHEPSLVF